MPPSKAEIFSVINDKLLSDKWSVMIFEWWVIIFFSSKQLLSIGGAKKLYCHFKHRQIQKYDYIGRDKAK